MLLYEPDMIGYSIARAFIDARITRIADGVTEVMKQIIARELFRQIPGGRTQ